jgi:hypothetical protein
VRASLAPDTASPTARREWLPTLNVVVLAAFVAWGVRIGSALFSDNSFITHLATGRLILDGSFPRSDPYSYTAAGEPWVVQSWLMSVVYAGLDQLMGAGGVHLLTMAVAGALGAIVWILTAPARSLLPRLLVGGLAMSIMSLTWSERPLVTGLLGLGIVLLALEGRVSPYFLVPVFWIWANSHGSYPFGILAIVCFLAGRHLDGEDTKAELRVLAFASAGTLAAVIGPLGIGVLTFPLETVRRADVLHSIIEWKSPDFSTLWPRMFLIEVSVAIVALVRRPSYRVAVPLVVFTAAALVAMRNIQVANLVLIPGLAYGLADLGQLRGDRRSVFNAALVGLLGCFAALTVVGSLRSAGWNLEAYPLPALGWSQDQGLLEPDVRMLSIDFVGNLREGILGADAEVFIDDRYDMYPTGVIAENQTLRFLEPGWEDVLDRREIDVVVWPSVEPLAQALRSSDDWAIRFQDGTWVVAVRRDDG